MIVLQPPGPPGRLHPVPRPVLWGVLALALYGAVALGRDGPPLLRTLPSLGRPADATVVAIQPMTDGLPPGFFLRLRDGRIQRVRLWGVAWPFIFQLPIRPEDRLWVRVGRTTLLEVGLHLCRTMFGYQRVAERVLGQEVFVTMHPAGTGYWSIPPVELVLRDGTHLNTWLLREGLATLGPPQDMREETVLRAWEPLVFEAQRARRGIWDPDLPCQEHVLTDTWRRSP